MKSWQKSFNFFISNFHSGFFNPYTQALLGSPMAQFQASPATAATVNMNHPLLGQMQVCTYIWINLSKKQYYTIYLFSIWIVGNKKSSILNNAGQHSITIGTFFPLHKKRDIYLPPKWLHTIMVQILLWNVKLLSLLAGRCFFALSHSFQDFFVISLYRELVT